MKIDAGEDEGTRCVTAPETACIRRRAIRHLIKVMWISIHGQAYYGYEIQSYIESMTLRAGLGGSECREIQDFHLISYGETEGRERVKEEYEELVVSHTV